MRLSDEDLLRRTVINQIRTYFEIRFSDFKNGPVCSDFQKHFEEELIMLTEFEKDKLLNFTDGGFELTELGNSLFPANL